MTVTWYSAVVAVVVVLPASQCVLAIDGISRKIVRFLLRVQRLQSTYPFVAAATAFATALARTAPFVDCRLFQAPLLAALEESKTWALI